MILMNPWSNYLKQLNKKTIGITFICLRMKKILINFDML